MTPSRFSEQQIIAILWERNVKIWVRQIETRIFRYKLPPYRILVPASINACKTPPNQKYDSSPDNNPLT
jgi:hypothetical protein